MNEAVAKATDEFMATVPQGGGIQITSNPVISPKYVQVITHYLSHQSNDYIGDFVTVNYDVERDDYIALDDLFSSGSHDKGSILTGAANILESSADVNKVTDAEIVGFFIRETVEEPVIEFFIKIEIESTNEQTSTALYSYLQDFNQLEQLDLQMIVDPLIVSEYEPELIANKIAKELINSTGDASSAAQKMTLVANFTSGSADYLPEQIKTYEVEHGAKISIEAIANELSILTGLDFFINSATIEGDIAYVEWSNTSTLIAGLDDRAFKEDFAFFDNVTLNWFMLDSLNDSIIQNLPVSMVYYTMNGTEDLAVPYMPPLAIFSADVPYMSSAFYYAHGEELGPVDFTVTEGTWRLDGDSAAAYFIMDGTGLVEAYYASGALEYSASLEQGYGGLSGFTVFEVINSDGELINKMWYDNFDEFYWGEPDSGILFIKE